ncbi:MAG TPA: phosphate propanoyltransferase [Elusimicrobiota bacterium]|nr:phosphate propanoyltransferase [Elusimicrobiota bacterium]
MEQNPELARKIAADVSLRMERSKVDIPVGVSNRHVHLCQEDWNKLFGEGAQPRKLKATKQPGYWAAYETVDVEGPRGKIEKMRLVAPHRPRTQVEVSFSDARVLGVRPPIRNSGSLDGTAPARIVGPKGAIEITQGLIIAGRHLHLAPAEAQALSLKDGDIVRLRAGAPERSVIFERVLCRVSDKFSLEFHIDTDEANAARLKTGDTAHLV